MTITIQARNRQTKAWAEVIVLTDPLIAARTIAALERRYDIVRVERRT